MPVSLGPGAFYALVNFQCKSNLHTASIEIYTPAHIYL